MKIILTQLGGWANVQLGCTLETEDLPPDQAREVESLLRSPPRSILRSIGVATARGAADSLQYKLEAQTPAGPTVVYYSDAARPRFRPRPRVAEGHQPLR
jgi:hypothetical protein